MAKTTFLLGIHNHQPVGNFPEVFETGYRVSYRPFIEVMKKFPNFRWSLHLSGILWDFMADKHPEYIADVRKMCDDGRLEILSGGYYEPILAVIPDRDKAAQIKKLNDFIKNNFGQTPRGVWLTERIWEPSLPKFLSEMGIEYTLTDDYHFLAAGLDPERLRGYYITEDEGKTLKIFPISQKLRYYVPFERVEKSTELFRDAVKYSSALSMGDDGEKFGMWPKTHEHVYGPDGRFEHGWLYKFFASFDENASWLVTDTFSGFLDSHAPSGRVYLPAASYFEMSEWTLPAGFQRELEKVVAAASHDQRLAHAGKFLRGGFWRNFLTKYSESNNMHKKMLRVSEKTAKSVSSRQTARSPKPAVAAPDHLYAGQCNCAYWHGVFGGLYLPHLRHAVYKELILAEKPFAPASPKTIRTDIDKDGLEEVIIETKSQNLFFAPSRGGGLYEWDLYSPPVNVLNVLTRRYEAYHEKIKDAAHEAGHPGGETSTIHGIVRSKEKNLSERLNYDWYDRASLLDHFFDDNITPADFSRCKFADRGDFTMEPYSAKAAAGKINLYRAGVVRTAAGERKITVSKTVSASKGAGISVEYEISNSSAASADLFFGTEFNLAFFAHFPKEEKSGVSSYTVHDAATGLTFEALMSPSASVWSFPVETVSLSEDGFERTLQGGCVLFSWKFALQKDEKAKFSVQISWKQ